jgi:hypothetical protein
MAQEIARISTPIDINGYPFDPRKKYWYRGAVEKARPIPVVEFPRTFQEMDDWFRSEAGCRGYICRVRWPDGFMCRHCGVVGAPWVMARRGSDAEHVMVNPR